MAHRDTSVSELCREFGIRPVTLYRYVGSRADVDEELVDQAKLTAWAGGGRPPHRVKRLAAGEERRVRPIRRRERDRAGRAGGEAFRPEPPPGPSWEARQSATERGGLTGPGCHISDARVARGFRLQGTAAWHGGAGLGMARRGLAGRGGAGFRRDAQASRRHPQGMRNDRDRRREAVSGKGPRIHWASLASGGLQNVPFIGPWPRGATCVWTCDQEWLDRRLRGLRWRDLQPRTNDGISEFRFRRAVAAN